MGRRLRGRGRVLGGVSDLFNGAEEELLKAS
jgi:hypothetical protein